MSASAESWDRRDRLYARLKLRNRVVGVLRWVVPMLGILVFLGLLVQIVLDSIGDQFGFSNVRIDRDNLVVDTPQLSAIGSDGTAYTVSAATARTAIGAAGRIDMTEAKLVVHPKQGGEIIATAATANMETTDQVVRVDGVTRLSDQDGMEGTLLDMFADFPNQRMTTGGAVALRLSDGTTLDAETMSFDGNTQTWTFNKASLVLQMTPGEATPADATRRQQISGPTAPGDATPGEAAVGATP